MAGQQHDCQEQGAEMMVPLWLPEHPMHTNSTTLGLMVNRQLGSHVAEVHMTAEGHVADEHLLCGYSVTGLRPSSTS